MKISKRIVVGIFGIGVTLLLLIYYDLYGSPVAQHKPSNPLMQVKQHSLPVKSIDWSSDGRFIASGSEDRTVAIWDISNGSSSRLTNFNGSIAAVAWSRGGFKLAIASDEPRNTLRLWEATTNRTMYLPDPGNGDMISSLAWSPSYSLLAVGTRELTPTGRRGKGFVYLYDTNSGGITQILTNPEPIDSIAWSPDGTRVAAGYSSASPKPPFITLSIWSIGGSEPVAKFEDAEMVDSLAWSPDGKFLASGSLNGTINIRDTVTGKKTLIFTAHTTRVMGLAWSPDGKFLASGSWDGYVRVWDTTGYKLIKEYLNPDYVSDIVWSPDGSSLAAACENGAVLVWGVR